MGEQELKTSILKMLPTFGSTKAAHHKRWLWESPLMEEPTPLSTLQMIMDTTQVHLVPEMLEHTQEKLDSSLTMRFVLWFPMVMLSGMMKLLHLLWLSVTNGYLMMMKHQ